MVKIAISLYQLNISTFPPVILMWGRQLDLVNVLTWVIWCTTFRCVSSWIFYFCGWVFGTIFDWLTESSLNSPELALLTFICSNDIELERGNHLVTHHRRTYSWVGVYSFLEYLWTHWTKAELGREMNASFELIKNTSSLTKEDLFCF